jgi:hypothetical protein
MFLKFFKVPQLMKMDEIAKVIGQWMKFKNNNITPFREIAISSSSSIYLLFF